MFRHSNANTRRSKRIRVFPANTARLLQLLLRPNLDERLLRHVAFVGGVLDAFEHVGGQSQRNAVRAGFEVGERDALRLRQIKVIGRVVRFPERTFFRLSLEGWQHFKCFVWHTISFPEGSW